MYVCLYVRHTHSNRFFFFVSRRNRVIFRPSVLHVALYKTLFFDFWFRPSKPQNRLTKIWTKIDYNSACMADRPEMFVSTRGFSGMADSMEQYKMLWGRPLLPWQRKFGLLFHKNRFFFFVSQRNRAIFGPSVLHVALYKTLFFDFWFRPPNAQNLLPKICTCTKSPITPLVCRGVVTALKPVRAEQVRRPEPPAALGVRGYYPLPGKFIKRLEILNAISCDLVHNYLMLQVPI